MAQPTYACDSKPLPTADFAKHFTPGEVLGKGSFGVVTLVTPTGLALSQIGADLPERLVAKTTDLARLKEEGKVLAHNEIAIMKQLNLKHMVKCYGAFESPDSLTIMMSVAPGQEFYRMMLDMPAVKEVYIHYYYQIAYNIAQAILELHQHGIAHRDIKMENMYVNIDRSKSPTDPTSVHVTLLDFAFSCNRATPLAVSCISRLGSPHAMIPSLKEGDSFEMLLKGDWWGYGVILGFMFYRVMAGKVYAQYPPISVCQEMHTVVGYFIDPEQYSLGALRIDEMMGYLEVAASKAVTLRPALPLPARAVRSLY